MFSLDHFGIGTVRSTSSSTTNISQSLEFGFQIGISNLTPKGRLQFHVIKSAFGSGEMSTKEDQCSSSDRPKEAAGNVPFHRSLSSKLLNHIQQLTDNEHQIGPCHKTNLYEDSWKLFYTSLLFMIPAVMAFLFNLFFLSGTSFTVSVVAMNYWRNAKFGWRRWIDMTVAKAAFLIYLSHAVMFARSLQFGVITAVITSTMYFLYTNVSVLIAKQSKEWINYHAAFHGMVILAQILVIWEMA